MPALVGPGKIPVMTQSRTLLVRRERSSENPWTLRHGGKVLRAFATREEAITRATALALLDPDENPARVCEQDAGGDVRLVWASETRAR